MKLFLMVILAVAITIVGVFFFGKKNSGGKRKKPVEVYMGLRSLALTGPKAVNAAGPFAVLMDMGMPNGNATVAAFKDGTASIYTSSGGGFIGGSQSHESLKRAAEQMLEVAAKQQAAMHQTTEYPLPGSNETTFYFVSDGKVFTATALTTDLGDKKHELYPLFIAGNEIITQYRTLYPRGGAK